MDTVIIAILSFFGFIIAYNTYGRYLARRIFALSSDNVAPSVEVNDGVDYVPTRRSVVFGHHFTSIAGTGPIVGPAIAVFWGWLPALLWVLFGSVFIGAVHDLGSLVVSMRNRGQTIGDIAGRMISPRARILFLLILFFTLMVVMGIFGLVIAVIFSIYPQTVLAVWIAMPLAVIVGWLNYKHGASLAVPAIVALVILYGAIYFGAYHLPLSIPGVELFAGADATLTEGLRSSVVIWTLLLLVYCFIASILPVWTLLQPRDFINSNQLLLTLALLGGGLVAARPDLVAPALNTPPPDAPPILPFLFITIACGAISGFHCLVSSGTSSKQLRTERDAHAVGYGAMLVEGMLAVLVILACCAGLGMGVYETQNGVLAPVTDTAGAPLAGAAAWGHYYSGGWREMELASQVGAFVEGGANMMSAVGVPLAFGVGIVAVMVASFAATTLDTSTRLQRYVVQELAAATGVKALGNKYLATSVAVIAGGTIAMISGPSGPGSGGLILWPLFGATNQLLAGLAFLVVAFYLIRHSKPVWFLAVPLFLMVVLPAWAMGYQVLGWYEDGNGLLVGVGVAVMILQAWMVLEGALLWRRAKGVLPEPLPPLNQSVAVSEGPAA